LAAIDFTSVEVWTRHGLVTFYLLFVMELKTRRVHFAGCTTSTDEGWVKQTARELTNNEDGFLNGKEYLIMDRDTKVQRVVSSIPEQRRCESDEIASPQPEYERSLGTILWFTEV
jgi:hypothetical protein